MDEKNNFHMTPAVFKHLGHAVVDWIANYYEQIESLPVLSRVDMDRLNNSGDLFLSHTGMNARHTLR